MTFNLTEKSWIPVVSQSWQRSEVSLVELFQTWDNWREVAAENPPTTLAIYRCLVAILHRAYTGPEDEEDWRHIREDDGQQAIAYLQDHADCFDLIHPDRPFMQDPGLTWAMGAEIYQAHSLHGNNTSTVFCHDHQWSKASLSLAEAARLVLRLHLFDVGGKKTGTTVSAGVIPTMDAANVLVKGKTLKETLLLNLMQYDAADRKPFRVTGNDIPTWERPVEAPAPRHPAGYIDYLTFQWRRVRLFIEEDRAVKVAFQGGDSLPKTVSAGGRECSIAYKKTKKGLLPIKLSLSRSLWRDSAAFLQSSDSKQSSDDYNCPKLLDWLSALNDAGLVDERLNLQIMGLSVDNAKPLGWVSEQFSAPIIYLKEDQKSLWDKLNRAIEIAEEHQKVFRSFKKSPYAVLAEALKHPKAADFATSLDGESHYWAILDQEFVNVLRAIPKTGKQAVTDWQGVVQKAAFDAFKQSIEPISANHARAKALNALGKYLAKLRGDTKQKQDKKP